MQYAIPITQRLRKLIKSLHQKQFRDENGMFVAEGEKLAVELFDAPFQTELIVLRDSSASNIEDLAHKFSDKGVPIYVAPKTIFDQMCDTKSPQGIICVVTKKEQTLYKDSNFIVLDGIADPGNIGTIIRTADWFGYKQIVLGPECSDAFNPKSVRSSMGSIFRTSIFHTDDVPAFIKSNFKGFKLFGADLAGSVSIKDVKPTKKYGIVFGSESHGISAATADILDNKFKIEGAGGAESLNVGIAVGISLYHFAQNIK